MWKKLLVLFLILVNQAVFAAKMSGETGRYAENVYVKEASDILSMRSIRRVGVGGSVLGNLGLYGIHLEMNFKPEWSLLLGYGGGPQYQSVTAQYRYILSGKSISPFAVLGVSRWYSSRNEGKINTEPSFLEERLLTESEKRNGKIDQNLIYPGFGLQYMNLNGEWAGFSMYLEVDVLTQLFTFKMAPLASVGATWYF